MKRTMAKMRFTMAVLLGVLCLGMVGLWVRSYWVYDGFGRSVSRVEMLGDGGQRIEDWNAGVESVGGALGVGIERWDYHLTQDQIGYACLRLVEQDEITHFRIAPETRKAGRPFMRDNGRLKGFLGFGIVSPNAAIQPTVKGMMVPHWVVVLVTAIYPTMVLPGWVRRWRRGRRKQCLACGYDLRATPGRCPECGCEPGATMAVTS